MCRKDIAYFDENYLMFCDYAYEDKENLEYSVYLGYDGELNMSGSDEHNFIYGFLLINYDLFSFLSPIDISKMYYEIVLFSLSINGDVNPAFIIDFGSHTEFSEMYPTPDYKDVSRIKFYDKEKIKCLQNGLRFHAKITDNEVVQTTKMFIITTFLSALFAYWTALFYNLIISILKAIRTK
ncbi:MAG: hypothetical protein J1F05_03125 [Muribaculaceae bacterium]|nr:hypothetical protein [Muribaculaceae bacterium]